MDRRKLFSALAAAPIAGALAVKPEQKAQEAPEAPLTIHLPPIQPGASVTVVNLGNNTIKVTR